MRGALVAILAGSALAVVGCASRQAGPPPAQALSAEQVAVTSAAGACPAARPGEGELAVLLWEQRTRTPEAVIRAASEVNLTPEAFAGEVGGPVVAMRPLTRALIDHALRRAGPLYRAVKDRCSRERPYLADARVHPALPSEESFSFPSGHATRGEIMGRLLAELAPDRADALRERGRQIGYDRVRGGVHYPSDVLAGQRVGDTLMDRWLQEQSFRRELEAARAEEWSDASGR